MKMAENMSRKFLFPLLILLFTCFSFCFSATNITVIIEHCDTRRECIESPVNQTSTDHHRSLVKLLSGGVNQLIWEKISRGDHESLAISPECRSSLSHVWSSVRRGLNWSFQNSSAKLPPGFLESTVTSYGDYDLCLATSSKDAENVRGQYCMVDVFPVGHKEQIPEFKKNGSIYLKSIPVFRGTPFYLGSCWPSTCSERDVRRMTQKAVSGLPLIVNGKISCDTQESISWKYRLTNLSTHQKISLFLILSLVSVIGYCSVVSLFRSDKNSLMYKLSILTTAQKLVYYDEKSNRTIGVDLLRVIVVIAGSLSHNLACLEVPLGFYLSNRHTVFQEVFTESRTQFFFNEGGLSGMTVLSGFAVLYYGLPAAKKGKFPILPAILDRYMSFVPPVIFMTAIDFLWPLTASGPFWTRVAEYVDNKCTRYWWHNLLLFNNFLHPLDICVAQTYTSSITFQLFVVSLPLVMLYVNHRKLANFISAFLAISGYAAFTYICSVKDVTPALFVSDEPSFRKTAMYLQYVHMHTLCYFPTFFVGFLLADYLLHDFKPTGGRKNYTWVLWTAMGLNQIATASTAIYNTWNLLPLSYVPLFLLAERLVFHAAMVFAIIYIFCDETLHPLYKITEAEKNRLEEPPKMIFFYKLTKFLSQLSVGYYLANYFFIRSEFFSSRTLWNNSVYDMCKRSVSGFTGMTIAALIFHLFVVSPFNELRKYILMKR